MKTKKILFMRILIWAYNKQEDGFTWDELKKEFNLNQTQDDWAKVVFLKLDNQLFSISPYKKEHTYIITEKGIPLAISYLNLKEAEKSSKRAEKIALAAIIIGIVVGLLQIYYK